MIQITDKLIAVLVPKNSKNHKITKFKTHAVIDYKQWLVDGLEFNTSENIGELNIKLLNYKILGTITKSGKISGFDCGNYVEIDKINSDKEENEIFYMDYFPKEYNHPVYRYENFTKEKSFITLLNSKGLFLKEINNKKILILEKI